MKGARNAHEGKKDPADRPSRLWRYGTYARLCHSESALHVGILTDTFETQIRDGLKNEFKKQYYTEAIKNIIY
ncbi:MAG: hypothetical protein II326_06785, partial [Clostridia bacterium]|nr:hypothetical protein [Clostridia bacterium]